MCGIAGIYNVEHPAETGAVLRSIAHRGPDAAGEYTADGPRLTWLGHRRLSILDPREAANQPYRRDGLVLIYNGEIYNFRAVRAELEARGVGFETTGDTEVLLEAWRAWGPACLRKLRGMFAFAIFDEASGRLHLVRDPLGIKPLFYMRHRGGYAFASEIKALLALDPALAIDPAGVAASLMYYWLPESRSVYRGVHKLPPGYRAELDPNGGLHLHAYWDPQVELVANPPPEPSIDELRAVLEDSVRAHLVSDVPVATFLSGGLDSSLVTVLAAAQEPSIEAYTISFRAEDQRLEAMPDDLSYAKQVGERYGIKVNEIEIAPDIVEALPMMVGFLDEPIGDPAAINTYLICQASRAAGVKVMLSGMGADELFGGYRKHLAGVLAGHYRRMPAPLRERVVERLVARLPVADADRGYRYARWAKRFVSFAGLPEDRAFHRSYTLFGQEGLSQLVSDDIARHIPSLVDEHASIYAEGPAGDHVNRMCYTDLRMFLPGLNLAYTDRSSMAQSTEVRVPYVDVHVARAAFGIPGRRKIRGRQGKLALKRAAEAWLPREIVYRPKGLFSAPLRAWIRRDLATMVDDLVVRGELVAGGMLNRPAVEQLVDLDRKGVEDNAKQIWQLLTLEIWYRRHAAATAVGHHDERTT